MNTIKKYYLIFLIITAFLSSAFRFSDEYGEFSFCKEIDNTCNCITSMLQGQVGDKAIFKVMFYNGFGEPGEPAVPVYWAVYKLNVGSANDYGVGDKINSATLIETISDSFPRGYQRYCSDFAYEFKTTGTYRIFLINKNNWATAKNTIFDYNKRDYYSRGDIVITNGNTSKIQNNDSIQSTKSKNNVKNALKKLFKLPS